MPTVEALIRETHVLLTNVGVPLSPSKVSRTCRDYVNRVEPTGVSFGDYLGLIVDLSVSERTGLDALYRRISYADPTGETAARNVDRKRGGWS